MPVPFSHERRQDQPEALLSYIEKRIKQAVVSGELKPGAKLSPSAVAVDLGVSHIPVREALTSLASDLVAFAAFADLEDAFEPLDVVVIQLASDVEHEVQRRHDMAPGK